MIIYLADRHMNIVATCSNNLPKGLKFQNDLKSEDVESGVATFSVDILYDEEDAVKTAQYCESGNYVLVYDDNEKNGFYTIIEAENDRKEHSINIYAEDGGLDLLNEVVDAYTADGPHPIAFYVEKFSYDSGFEIGLNEVSDLNRTLSWVGQDTCTARILSVANSFDAEIGFSFTVKNMTITHKYINIYKKRGNENVAQLRLNTDIDNIIVKSSISDLTTCLIPSGGTPEGSEHPITLAGYKYDDGDIYVNELGWVASRSALAKWSRYQWEKYGSYGGHIVKYYTYDTISQSELCNRTISYLKKYYDIIYNYEVDIAILPDNVRIGDTVNIIDENGELYLNARVLKLETSSCDKTATATLGDFLIKSGGISEKVKMMAEQFSSYVIKQREYSYKTQQLAKQAKEEASFAITKATEASNKAVEAKQEATNAISKATNAIAKATDATNEASNALKVAADAKNTAADSLSKIKSATVDLEKAKQNITNLRNDINTTNKSLDDLVAEAGQTKETLDGLSGDLQETKENLEITYAKKTDLSSTEASLKTEITKSATELSARIEKTYAGKTELTDIQGKLQSQITQNAEGLTSQATKIDKIQNDTTDTQAKITAASRVAADALVKAKSAQTSADIAKSAADDAQSAADDAATNAQKAQTKADEAQSMAASAAGRLTTAEKDLSDAKANLTKVTSDVNSTKEQVQAAQDAVTAAQAKVNQATKDASEAQIAAKNATTTANNAKTAASEAQQVADNAKIAADEASKTAQTAKDTANKAQETVAALTKRVTLAETNITQNAEAIKLNAKKTEEVGDKLKNDYYSKTETDALLKVESNKITSTVSRVETVEKKSLTATVEEFYQSTSPTTLTGGTWSKTQPAWSQGKYIWRRFLITKGDGSTSYSPSVNGVCISGNTGSTGATGKGIKSSTVTYQGSTSGTTVPTGTWSTNIPTVAQGQYLWTKTVIAYTDNTTTTSYSVSYISKNGNDGAQGPTGASGPKGDKGDKGRGIDSTVVTYQAWKDGTTTPTGAWSTTPPTTTADKPYLWTKTVITYTDGTSSTGYSVGSTPEGIIVGGRNLLKQYIRAGGQTIKISDTSIKLVGNGLDTFFFLKTLVSLTRGETYTISFDASGVPDGCKWAFGINNQLASFKFYITKNGRNFATGQMASTIGADADFIIDDYSNRPSGAQNIILSNFKLEKGNKATDWTPAPEDVANDISAVDTKVTAVSTKATQLADKFNWLVKSGTSATDFTLTDRTATLISNYINLNGLVTFMGLNSETRYKINSAKTTANSASSTASNALSTANSAKNIADKVDNYTVKSYGFWVDLTSSSYDINTYYPVVFGNKIPYRDGWQTYAVIMLPNNDCHPAWATHTLGFTVTVKWKLMCAGWGTTDGKGYIEEFSYKFCERSPVYVGEQFRYGSRPVVYLRGGGKYKLISPVIEDTATIYSSRTNLNDSEYPWYVEPTKTPSNAYPMMLANEIGSWCSANDRTLINGAKIYTGSVTAEKISVNTLSSLSANLGSITAGSININNKFIVDSAGNLKATSAELTGKITATSGTIAGINIESGRLYTSKEAIVHHRTGDPVSSTDSNRCYVLNTTELYDTGYLKVKSDYTVHSQTAEDNQDLSGTVGVSIIRGGYLTIEHDAYGGGYTSILGSGIEITSNTFGMTSIRGGDINSQTIMAGSGWLGTQYFAESEWIGFYNSQGGTRKGWIGHNGTADLCIINEAGGTVKFNQTVVLNSGYWGASAHHEASNNCYSLYWASYDGGNGRLKFNIYNGTSWGSEIHMIRHSNNSMTSFRPGSDGGCYLGTSNCRWATVYSTSGSVSTSDMKQKEVIEDYDFKARDFIMGLNPIAYKLKSPGAGGKRIHMGFGAQPVNKLIKDLNMGDLSIVEAWKIDESTDIEEAYHGEEIDDEHLSWGMKYEELFAPLIALVQEQQIKIEKLEKLIGGK